MLAHEDGRVCVVHEIAGQVRQLRDHFCGHIAVPLGRDENSQSLRGEQRRDELAYFATAPRCAGSPAGACSRRGSTSSLEPPASGLSKFFLPILAARGHPLKS
jgi:hypothetical protein